MPNQSDSNNAPFFVKDSKIVWSCPWYHIQQDQLLLPDGSEQVYNVVRRPNGAAFAIPVLDTGEIVLINHYRHTVGTWVWEVPAGGIKEHQSPQEAAEAELHEEIGGSSQNIQYLGDFYTAVGFCGEICHIYLATNVKLGAADREPLEFMKLVPTPAEEAFEMARNGTIKDALSALALLWAEPHLKHLVK